MRKQLPGWPIHFANVRNMLLLIDHNSVTFLLHIDDCAKISSPIFLITSSKQSKTPERKESFRGLV